MFKWLFAFLLLVIANLSQASLVVYGTRIIYPSDKSSITVQLSNEGASPSLMQAWLDDGNEKADPKNIKLPFIITPPVSRINAKQQQILRIAYTGEPLAQDRESLFFFNLLDIPPKPSKAELAKNPNYLQLAMRSRLKFFFRPSNLPYPVTEAYNKVEWRVKGAQIIAHNPTPYFITYSHIALKSAGKTLKAKDADMVAPFSSRAFTLNGNGTSASKVEWQIINDFGGENKGSSILK